MRVALATAVDDVDATVDASYPCGRVEIGMISFEEMISSSDSPAAKNVLLG